MRYLMGVDVGTYSSKGVLVKETGEVVASKTVDHVVDMPKPGYYEHDPEKVWWHDFLEICHALLENSKVDPRQVISLGISTISPAVVPVDSEGQALRPAILYGIDTRATQEIAELEKLFGVKLTSQSAAPKVLWIRRNEPEVWRKTHLIVNGSGYLNLKLTGEATIDFYDATAFAPLFDLNKLNWSNEIAPHVCPSNKLPRPTWSCEIAGRITSEASRVTGLLAGTPVITGTADAAAESVSAGLEEAGDMMLMYGSSTFFILRTKTLCPSDKFWGAPFLEKNTFVVAGGTATAGSLTTWFRDQFGIQEMEAERLGRGNAYALLAKLAESSAPGSRGLIVLPYFAGERTPIHDPMAKGVLFGLTLSHTRADIYRAILESVGFAIRHNLDTMKKEGIVAKRIFAVGGGTKNAFWLQLVSDIANIHQYVPEQQIGASYGDAFMAGVGVGLFSSTTEASRWVKIKQVISPELAAHSLYNQYYRMYLSLYENTKDLMRQIG